MQKLLEHLRTTSIPFSDRQNVSSLPVRSMTLGMLNKRQAGYGISVATTSDRLRLLQLLIGVANDSGIAGNGPECFTSMCLNVDFASEVHTDSHNSGHSWIVAGGDFNGGGLFVEKDVDERREERSSIEYAGSPIDGVSVDIKNSWYKFDGSNRHCTLPYSGNRVTVVFFSVPAAKCDTADSARLKHLGFKIADVSSLSIPLPWPYHVFICTTRRSTSIVKDTLSSLFQDRSVPPHTVTLCVRDREDAGLYCHLGLRLAVAEDATAGLPEQRRICTKYLPRGSWCLFLDDDVTHIHTPEHLDTHHLIMLGFLTAQQKQVHLWGLNTSADPRNLRENMSGAVGLVNGYFFGIITHPDLCSCTRISDAVGGAGEDIERSLRYYVHSGILRLNFATACAKNRTNVGGLQCHYSSRVSRQAAHEYVIHLLFSEFPNHVTIDATRPNGCKFRRRSASAADEARVSEESEVDDTDEPLSQEEDTFDNDPNRASHRWKIQAQRGKCCSMCDKTYARAADLRHHMRTAHASGEPIQTFACPVCAKVFRRHKDMVVHVKMQRCHSKRGRPHDASDQAEKPSSDGV